MTSAIVQYSTSPIARKLEMLEALRQRFRGVAAAIPTLASDMRLAEGLFFHLESLEVEIDREREERWAKLRAEDARAREDENVIPKDEPKPESE